MAISISKQPVTAITASWLVVGVYEDDTAPPAALAGLEIAGTLARIRSDRDLTGSLGETVPILGVTGLPSQGLLLVGLGPRAAFGRAASYAAGGACARKLGTKPRGRVAFLVPAEADASATSDLVAGLIVGQRGPDLYKAERARHAFEEVVLVGPEREESELEAAVRTGTVLGEAVNLARELTNSAPVDKPPGRLAWRMREIGEACGVRVDIWGEERLRRERFGGLLGVSAGSEEPPAFVCLSYRHGGDGPTLALVGKGVTFDAGGLSLKPTDSMLTMKSDMAGAAIALATVQAVARLGLSVNVVGYLPLTENLTGGRALKLGDVLTIRDGTTVEVHNTDAEGRLILADALSYAVEGEPARIIDVATLTGGCMVALGSKTAGLYCTDEELSGKVIESCSKTGERVWRMPLDDTFNKQLESSVADLKNVGGRWGSPGIAAQFLRRFVKNIPWAHLDIAGPSWVETANNSTDEGGTGCFVRTLVALIQSSVG